MGITRFSGPAYGAKALLYTVSRDNLANSTVVQTVASILVPTYQDWLLTEVHVFRGSTFSTALTVRVLDDSTAVASVAITSSLANVAGSTTVAADGGEYEGLAIAGGSSVVIDLANATSSVAGSSGITVALYGFIRWIASTRAF